MTLLIVVLQLHLLDADWWAYLAASWVWACRTFLVRGNLLSPPDPET